MSKSTLDIGRARLLVDEISSNLASLPAGSAKYAELREEVDALRALLEGPDASSGTVVKQMRSVHDSFDKAAAELRADGVRAGVFLSEIGRMLGLD